jgi:predicted GTPase
MGAIHRPFCFAWHRTDARSAIRQIMRMDEEATDVVPGLSRDKTQPLELRIPLTADQADIILDATRNSIAGQIEWARQVIMRAAERIIAGDEEV